MTAHWGDAPEPLTEARMMQYIRSKPEEDRAGIVGKRNVLGPAQWKRGLAKSGREFDKKGRFVGSPRRVPEELIQPKELAPMQEVEWPRFDDDKNDLQRNDKSSILLSDAKTLDDLSSYAQSQWGVKNVDIAGLDVDDVKGTFQAMDAAIEKFPYLKGGFDNIVGKDIKREGTLMTAGNRTIELNTKYYGENSDVDLATLWNQNVSIKHFPAGTNWTNAGVHELGHIAQQGLKERVGGWYWDAGDGRELRVDTSGIIEEAWNAAKGAYPKDTSLKDAIQNISGRAAVDRYETIAEAYSDVFSNGNAAIPLSREIVKLITKIYGGKNVRP
jgi:hypothetical protein